MQADMWDRYSIDNDLPLDGFTGIVGRIGERAAVFDGKVLLVKGENGPAGLSRTAARCRTHRADACFLMAGRRSRTGHRQTGMGR